MCKVLFAVVATMALSLTAAPKAEQKAPVASDHVPATLNGIRPVNAKAAAKNHLVLVNVNHAIPDEFWPLVSTYAASRVNLNVWTNALASSIVGDLVADQKALQRHLGDKAVVGVFVENKVDGAPFLNAPGRWSMVNVRSMHVGNPDPQTLKDRYAKMILKGIAYAAGSGMSLDAQCSMYFGGFSLEGLDKTGIRLSPMCYFPMLETLRAIGGSDITAPVFEE